MCGALCSSGDALAKDLRKRNAVIEKDLQRARKKMNEDVRILLLGTGESGKSTVFKQMTVMGPGYSSEQRKDFTRVVAQNCLSQMKVLCTASVRLKVEFENRANSSERIARMLELTNLTPVTPELWNDFRELWADIGMQQVLKYQNKVFQLNDSSEYFFNDIDRISAPDFVPTDQDILRARVRSTGIEEELFSFGDFDFTLIDVGGQRNERRKWIHCFDSVTCLLFVCGLSEYDQVLREDETQNRMKESLLLFDEIANSPWFRSTAIILFLNKTDLFKEKIKTADLRNCFPEYFGGPDFDKATKFVKERFLELNRSSEHIIYPHLTCAIDTTQMRYVFNAVKDVLVKQVNWIGKNS